MKAACDARANRTDAGGINGSDAGGAPVACNHAAWTGGT